MRHFPSIVHLHAGDAIVQDDGDVSKLGARAGLRFCTIEHCRSGSNVLDHRYRLHGVVVHPSSIPMP